MPRLGTNVFEHTMILAFEEVDDQSLWITHLTLCATLSHLDLGELMTQLTHHEIERRFGPESNELASQFFTQGHFTHTEMITFVKDSYEHFLEAIRPPVPEAVALLMQATDEELRMAIDRLTPDQRTALRQHLMEPK